MAKIKKAQSAMVDQDRQWKVNSAMDTLLRYNELLADKALMADVQKKAQDQLSTVTNTLKMGGKVTKKAVSKKPMVKKVAKKVVKKKKKLPAKKAIKWPPPGFEKKAGLYAKTASPKELLIAGTENKYIQKNLIKYCLRLFKM